MTVALAQVGTLASCTRPGRPGTRPTTTAGTGSTAHGRYADQVFTGIDKTATGVTYKPADPAGGRPGDLKLDAWALSGETATVRPAIVWRFGGAFVAGDRSRPAPQHVSCPGQGPIIMFGGTSDNVVSYRNWQQVTCRDHEAAGNVCELITYQGLGHGVFAQLPDLLNRSAAFVKVQVLIPRGYAA